MKRFTLIPAAFAVSSMLTFAQSDATETKADSAKKENSELESLTEKNSLEAEKLKAELAQKRAEITRLKLERELLSEQQQIEELKQAAAEKAVLKAAQDLEQKMERDAAIAKNKATIATSELSLETTAFLRKTSLQEAELEALKISQQRENFADSKPIYLEKPLTDDNTLIISDRRISFNGAVTSKKADHICDRIHYFNNKDKKMPIFIVIDSSPGGSVMAGYRILKAMEGSDAPIHVVVKSFAASMAASIATLAEESYAYPNAIILHHQISSTYFFTTMNLTQQKESLENSKKWWEKLAAPIAKKMGITTDEFIKQMYSKNSDGDWMEFATEAHKIKWVNHIVHSIKETSAVINPDTIKSEKAKEEALEESIGKDGKPCIYLPRLNPYDAYFLYNPDKYYRIRE